MWGGGYFREIKNENDTNYTSTNWIGFYHTSIQPPHCFILTGHFPDFCFCQLTQNFFIAKTKSIKKVWWNETIKAAGEHNDFFLRAMQTQLKVGFTNSLFTRHFHPSNTPHYAGYRYTNTATIPEDAKNNMQNYVFIQQPSEMIMHWNSKTENLFLLMNKKRFSLQYHKDHTHLTFILSLKFSSQTFMIRVLLRLYRAFRIYRLFKNPSRK